jgi:glutaminase
MEHAHRNLAIGHMLRSHHVLTEDPVAVVEGYTRQCSVLVTVRDLAVMAATLAFGGLNPVTGERVVSERVARDVTSIMASCGMYDFSGEWMLRVGLPAKSGVSGGVMAVAPSQFGVAAFSPRLDAHGNSVRASSVVDILSDRFGMHLLDVHESLAAPGISVVQTAEGPMVRLGGELGFAGAERVLSMLREIAAGSPNAAVITVDVAELARTHPAAVLVLQTEIDGLGPRVRLLDADPAQLGSDAP